MSKPDDKTYYPHIILKTGDTKKGTIDSNRLQDAPPEFYDNLACAHLKQGIDIPTMVSIEIDDEAEKVSTASNSQKDSSKRRLSQNQQFAMKFKASRADGSSPMETESDEEFLLVGRIRAVEANTTGESKLPNEYMGADESICLYDGNHIDTFKNSTYSDIVRKILGKKKLKIGHIDDSEIVQSQVTQGGQTHAEFIRSLADRIGFEFFVRGTKVYFRKPTADNVIPLEWGQNIESCKVTLETVGQVNQIVVSSWDPINKVTVKSTRLASDCETESTIGRGGSESLEAEAQSQDEENVLRVHVSNGWQQKEVEMFAQVLCQDLSQQLIKAEVTCQGDPRIVPGVRVDIRNQSGDYDELNGYYYVTEVEHIYAKRKYITVFRVSNCRYRSYIKSDLSGVGNGDDVSGVNTGPMAKPSARIGQTPIVGIVTDIEDPEDLGRVKVMFPTLSENDTSDWAKVVSVGAGAGKGIHWLPEVNDEVLVIFLNGDIDSPCVVGEFWNGCDRPPTKTADAVQDGQVVSYTIRTKAGHTITFQDEDCGDKKKGVYIETTGGHQIYLDDTEKNLTIKSPEIITLDATQVFVTGELIM